MGADDLIMRGNNSTSGECGVTWGHLDSHGVCVGDQRFSPGSCPSTSGRVILSRGRAQGAARILTHVIYGQIFCLIAEGCGNFPAVTDTAKSPLTYCNGGFSYAK